MRFLIFARIIFFLLFTVNVAFAEAPTSVGQTLEDSVITTKIKAKFTKNRYLNPLKISVSTNHGVVTLSGFVHDKTAFVEALRLAKNTANVSSLEVDDLVIKETNTAFTDAYITTKVEAAILKAKVFYDESIPLVGVNATTTNGEVTLSGVVKNRKSVVVIIKQVNAIKGVKKIISNLEVEHEATKSI